MVYAENTLVLWHQPTGICIEFDAKSCLEGVVHVEQAEQIQVPAAVTWKKQARFQCGSTVCWKVALLLAQMRLT